VFYWSKDSDLAIGGGGLIFAMLFLRRIPIRLK
jgi:hypothetical protein